MVMEKTALLMSNIQTFGKCGENGNIDEDYMTGSFITLYFSDQLLCAYFSILKMTLEELYCE